MTITLRKDKKEKIKKSCQQLLTPRKICHRELVSAIANVVANFTAVPYGPLYYRIIEKGKLELFKISKFNYDTKEIWEWGIQRNLLIWAAHIPGCNNVEVDLYSRELEDAKEWKLNTVVFKYIKKTFGAPDLDLFANRFNKQLPKLVSWHLEPETWAIDAFSLVWKHLCSFKCFFLLVLWARYCQKCSGRKP